MKTQSLKSFITLAETLHFARAARQIGIGQATLSQQIAGLETQIGIQLFHRDSRNVALTPAGAAFLPEAMSALAQLDTAVARAISVARGEVGELRVGATSAALLDLIPLTVETLAQQHEGLSLRVQEFSSMVLERMLLAKELDVAMLHPPVVAEGIQHEPLGEEPMRLAMWDEHPLAQRAELTLRDLDGERLLVPLRSSAPHLLARIETAVAKTGAQVTFEEHHCAPMSVLTLVAARRGVAFVPGQVRHMCRPNVVIRPMLDSPLMLGMAVAWATGERRASVHAFVRATRVAAQARGAVLAATAEQLVETDVG